MIKHFILNGYFWHVLFVPYDDSILIDRTGQRTVAVTDRSTLSVYLSSDLDGEFLYKVLVHELGHCAIFSFHLDEEIHRVVKPKYWIESEEWICNFLWDYGLKIFEVMSQIFGDKALEFLPHEIEKLLA